MRIKMSFVPNIRQGQELSNKDIVDVFKCSARGGMRRSKRTNTLVIVSDHTTNYYTDLWDNNILHYTGMGQTGDQSLSFAQNRTLNESDTNGVSVHLFEVFTEGIYVYEGQVKLAGKPYQKEQPDFKGNNRKVWIFPLKLVEKTTPAIMSEESFQREQFNKERLAKTLSNEELIRRIRSTTKTAAQQKVVSNRFVRNGYVAEIAKRNAQGKCQLCGQPAPFNDRSNNPYLETHHIQWLSKGGEDTTENTVALCPNCHRKMHILDLEKDKNQLRNHARQ
jgi:5-methylcytosine-specific restriction protein A